MSVEGWKTGKLRDITVINYGKSPVKILSPEGQYPVVGTGETERLGTNFLYDGESIILGRKGSIDRVYFASGKFWAIDTAYYLSDFRETFPRWLFYYLQTIDLRQMNEATGVPSLSREFLYNIALQIPAKAEQTQIATILSTIDRAIEQTEALIAKQQRIKTGLMQDLLTKGIDENGNIRSEETHEFKDSPLGRIPVEWEVKPLASVAEIIMGQSPQGYTYNQIGEGTPLINGPTEFGTRYIERVNQWTTSPTKLCKRGDVLFCVRGSTTGRINIANDVYCIGRGLAAIREVKNKSINSFLELFLTQLVEQLFSEASGSGSTFPSITSNRLSATLILVPSIEEQNQIVLIINSYDRHICTEETHLNKLHSLKTGLMQDLLTGKVRVTDLLNQNTATN
jgi:type I restriction enzyme S subunit